MRNYNISNTLMKNKPSSLVDESEMLNDEPILVNDGPINVASKFKKSVYFLVLPSHLISVLGLDGEGIVYNGNYGAIPMKGTTYGKSRFRFFETKKFIVVHRLCCA